MQWSRSTPGVAQVHLPPPPPLRILFLIFMKGTKEQLQSNEVQNMSWDMQQQQQLSTSMEVLSLYCYRRSREQNTHNVEEHSKQNMRKNFVLLPFGRISNQLCSRSSRPTQFNYYMQHSVTRICTSLLASKRCEVCIETNFSLPL